MKKRNNISRKKRLQEAQFLQEAQQLRDKAEKEAFARAERYIQKTPDLYANLKNWFRLYSKREAVFSKFLTTCTDYMADAAQYPDGKQSTKVYQRMNHISGRVRTLSASITSILADRCHKEDVFRDLLFRMENATAELAGESALIMHRFIESLKWSPDAVEECLTALTRACEIPDKVSRGRGRPVNLKALHYVNYWKHRFGKFTDRKITASEGAFLELANCIGFSEKEIRTAVEKYALFHSTKPH